MFGKVLQVKWGGESAHESPGSSSATSRAALLFMWMVCFVLFLLKEVFRKHNQKGDVYDPEIKQNQTEQPANLVIESCTSVIRLLNGVCHHNFFVDLRKIALHREYIWHSVLDLRSLKKIKFKKASIYLASHSHPCEKITHFEFSLGAPISQLFSGTVFAWFWAFSRMGVVNLC